MSKQHQRGDSQRLRDCASQERHIPLAPKSDEETAVAAAKPEATEGATAGTPKNAEVISVQIDLDHVGQRILSLPFPQQTSRTYRRARRERYILCRRRLLSIPPS